MENIEVRLPGRLCYRIKEIYHKDEAWIDCYDEVSSKLSKLKKNLLIFYPTMDLINKMEEADKLPDYALKEMIEYDSVGST